MAPLDNCAIFSTYSVILTEHCVSPSTHSVHPREGSSLGSTHVVQLVDTSYSGPAGQVTHVMFGSRRQES